MSMKWECIILVLIYGILFYKEQSMAWWRLPVMADLLYICLRAATVVQCFYYVQYYL